MSFYYAEPTDAQRRRGQPIYDSSSRFAERFSYYGSAGLLDPKMPLEAYALRTGSLSGITTRAGWSALGLRGFAIGASISMAGAVVGLGFAGAILDPFDVNEGGLDEFYRPPIERFVREAEQIYFVS